jgi:hypothetical protein
VHGALSPSAVRIGDGGLVLASPSARRAHGFDAPEVVRGGRPTRLSDAFSLGALVYLVLAGSGPFAADEPLETIRRVLFAEPAPLRPLASGLSPTIAEAIARLLEKRPRRRARAGALLRALGAGEEAWTAAPIVRAASRVRPSGPLARAALVALPVAALTLRAVLGGDAALAREVAADLARGDHAAARVRLEEAARTRRGDPLVEKLRGDLACASGAPDECLRRYRSAIAARRELGDDPGLRRNARALLRRDLGCGTRRATAQLLGELRDRDALPALEEARRSGGLLAFLCAGDALDRAIAATRTARK